MTTRAEEIASELIAGIGSGEWRLGQRLPSERALTGRFSASRVVVREALAALRSQGLVASRRGSGAYVVAERPAGVGVPLDAVGHSEILDCLELRRAVEVEAAALAARRARPSQILAVQDAIEAMEQDVSAGRASAMSDWTFHLAIADATGNFYFRRVMVAFGPDAIPRHKLLGPRGEPAQRVREEQLLSEHRAVLAALVKGDGPEAARAMRHHLTEALTRYRRDMRPVAPSEDRPSLT